GMKHSIPFNTNFKVAKHFSVSLGGNFEDNWVTQTFARSMVGDKMVLDTLQGFDRFSQYNLSASIGTTLYGTFVRQEGKRIQALRHVMRPSASIGYTPAYDQYYDEYLGTDGTMVPYSRFEGTLYGAPGLNSSQSLGFSLQNALEAKVRSKDSTRTEPRKVKIIENLTISSSYNFQADSLRLNPFRFTGGTSLFDNQLKLNINGNLDPYDIDAQGRRINTLVAQQNGALMRLTRASANLSYSINSDMFKKDKKQTDSSQDEQDNQGDLFYAETSQGRTDGLFGRNSNPYETGYNAPKKPSEIKNPVYATEIQWNFNLAYAVTYANEQRQSEFSNNSLMFSGDIQLTPKWGMGVSSGYDFKNQGFTLTQIRIDRDLNDFRLNFDWTPFGAYERWYFFIGIKSSMLSDLKWEKRNQR
ncbi:MAG: putative LPS assembly protein LptD, partial [Flavobacteriaceae bacterium]